MAEPCSINIHASHIFSIYNKDLNNQNHSLTTAALAIHNEVSSTFVNVHEPKSTQIKYAANDPMKRLTHFYILINFQLLKETFSVSCEF